jgi:hypothetical protein
MACVLGDAMKPVRIEFITAPRWPLVWLPAAVAIAIGAGAFYAVHQSLDGSTSALRAKTARVMLESQALRQARAQAAAAQAADPAANHLKSIGRQLRADWNPAFATIENLAQHNTRLLFFSIDASSESIRLEYEVPTMDDATSLTAQMNGGVPHSPWKLESVTAPNAGAAGAAKMRGTWSAKLGRLR